MGVRTIPVPPSGWIVSAAVLFVLGGVAAPPAVVLAQDAQDPTAEAEVDQDPAAAAPPATAPATQPATQPAATTAPAVPAIVQAVRSRDFSRQPKRVLEAIYAPSTAPATAPATQPTTAPATAAATQPSTQPADPAVARAERFERDVLAGNWPAVAEFLRGLPQNEADPVYLHLLSSLLRGGGGPGGGGGAGSPARSQERARLQQMRQMGLEVDDGSGGEQQGGPQPIILPDQVLLLADAYPFEPTPAHVAALAKLLQASLARADVPSMVVAELERGRGRFGGKDPADRRRAATLLLGAGLDALAMSFLPPTDGSTDDRSLLDDKIRALIAVGDRLQRRTDTQEDREAAELRRIYEQYGYSASLVPSAPQAPKAFAAPHAEALMLSARLVALPALDPPARAAAIDRALRLLPKVEQPVGEEFLRRLFAARPEEAGAVVAIIGGASAQQAGTGPDVAARAAGLALQRRIADKLLAEAGRPTPATTAALDVLATTWLAEARATESQPPAKEMARSGGRRLIRLPDGSMTYYSSSQFRGGGQSGAAVPEADLLAAGPQQGDGRWLNACGPSLRPAVVRAVASLLIRDEQPAKAMDWIERLTPLESAAATDLSAQLLRTWARTANPNPGSADQEQQRMAAMQGMSVPQQGGGISLTRVRQDRNMRELAGLLARMRKLPGGPPPTPVVAEAFAAAHSDAEVFRPEHVQAVFGPVADMEPAALASLLGTMRQRLAQQWRRPQVQQQAGTKRDDKAIAAEVDRGYRLVVAAADASVAKQGAKWPTELAAATATFDWNEFKYGRGLPLAEYTQRRDAAFARFAAAASAYGAEVRSGSVPVPSETVNPYMSWFLAALGASDLAQLTRQQTPQLDQVTLVKNAIAALPPEAAARHTDAFAAALVEQSRTVNAELKHRYLAAGLAVVGPDHPKAAAAAELVKYYGELLGELEVVARLDGTSTAVGRQPFGVHFGVRHTASLGRESGGFGRYLVQPNAAANMYMSQMQNQVRNDRDRVEKNVREALSDSFEILSITWHAADVEPQGDVARQPGWRYTPLAFLLLKAKDVSADRVPPIRMDLDFRDSTGRVVLPVESSVVAVDTRTDPAVEAADLANVTVTQTLDESEAAKGQLTLDVRAAADGLLPDLDKLLDLSSVAPWAVQKTGDGTLTVSGMEMKGERVRPKSTRSWILTLQRPAAADAPAGAAAGQFRYPPPLPGVPLADGAVKYQRYVGTDLASVQPTIDLKSAQAAKGRRWLWPAVAAGLAIVGLTIAVLILRRRRGRGEDVSHQRVPDHLTPFSLIALLRRLEQGGGQNGDLQSEIKRLELAYFSPTSATAAAAADPHELHGIARKWVKP